jgi:hypothetical protein
MTASDPVFRATRPLGVARARRENSAPVLARQQWAVLEHCVESGELVFSQSERPSGSIRPRLFPLLCAPTGSGKSMLVAKCAETLGAHYRRTQRGDLAPQGASRVRASMFQILDLLVLHERVLWHIDELDKFTGDGVGMIPGNEWGASIFSDLWSALDGVFPINSYLALEDRPRAKDPAITCAFLENKVRRCLYIVGSGTWQEVFARAAKPGIGFSSTPRFTSSVVTAGDIRRSQLISPELLARFSADLLILSYPDRDEITSLLTTSGIASLAREVGYAITDEDVDFRSGGFRVLETLLSRLLVLRHRRGRPTRKARPGVAISSDTRIES